MAGAFPPNTIASLTAPPRQRGGGEDRVDQEAQYGQLTYSGHKAERGHFRDTTKATAENYTVEHHPRGTPITGSLPPQSPLHYDDRESTATGLLISSPRAPREAVRPLDSLSSADVAALLSARGIAAVVVAKLLAVPLCGADLALATHADLARDVGLGAPTIKKLLALCASYAREGVPLSHFERAPRAPPSPEKPVPFEARPLASAGRVDKNRSRPKLGASGTGFSVSGGGDRLLLARAKAQQPPVDAAAAVARVKTIAGKAGDASVASAAARRKEQVLERRAEVAEARAAAAESSLAMARRREAALEAKALSLQQRLAAVEVKLAEANMAAWNSANRA